MYLALTLFLATYVLLLLFGKYRAYIAAASALLFVVLGIILAALVLGLIARAISMGLV